MKHTQLRVFLPFILCIILFALETHTISPVEEIIKQHWDQLQSSGLFEKDEGAPVKKLDNDFKHVCDHDHFMLHNNIENKKRNVDDELFKELDLSSQKRLLPPPNAPWEPIRIYLDSSLLLNDSYACKNVGDIVTLDQPYVDSDQVLRYDFTCTQDFILTPTKMSYILDHVVPAVINIVQYMLSVQRVTGNFTLDPVYHQKFGVECRTGLNIPSHYIMGPGIPDTDYILFVSARPIQDVKILANALPCSQNVNGSLYNRPTAGSINFNSGSSIINLSDYTNPFIFDQAVKLGVHEVTHALGFTSYLFKDFTDHNGIPYNSPYIQTSFPNGRSTVNVFKVSTPNVALVAKSHYNCSQALGVDLEESDTKGQGPGSHWEKKYVGSEYMASVTSIVSPISVLTLALFEDMGWYKSNYSMAEDWKWGFAEGCSFLDGRCENWPSRYFCEKQKQQSCNPERTARGSCSLVVLQTQLDPYYQHFASPFLGGDMVYDYCPIFEGFTNYYCSDEVGGSNLLKNSQQIRSLGNNFGSNSKCYEVDLLDGRYEAACYETKCIANEENETQIAVKIGPNWYGCPLVSGWRKIDIENGPVVSVFCPQVEFFCSFETNITFFELSKATVTQGSIILFVIIFMISSLFV